MRQWDRFVEDSRNGTFLFLRGYMEYHSDRFADHSLLFLSDKGKILAVMPANERDGVLYTHQGLTYGGLVLGKKVHASEIGEMFDYLTAYMKTQGLHTLIYKMVPQAYHVLPSEEDEYWLWRLGGRMTDCAMMTAIPLADTVSMSAVSQTTKNDCSKLTRQGYKMHYDAPLTEFWPILTANLMSRFGATPVHTLQEMQMLQERFPKNIICSTLVSPDGETVAGCVLYITQQVVRTQYISASPEGKRVNALDMLLLTLIRHYREQRKYQYFDFGTSMAEDGISLNGGLIAQKEGFGGRGMTQKKWELKIGQ